MVYSIAGSCWYFWSVSVFGIF